MSVYYNDSEPFVCDWLENLIREKLLPEGVVDRRPIEEVRPEDVRSYTQCHFFAGIGGWPYALQLANWGDRPVWTGSCPCQPFSVAGQRRGTTDTRHLWPIWVELIRECRPPTIFGEQVTGPSGIEWLDAVSADLERLGYAIGAADLCAPCVGAPHRRNRLWFVADTTKSGRPGEVRPEGRVASFDQSYTARRTDNWMGHAASEQVGRTRQSWQNFWWSKMGFVECNDGAFRPTESGVFPLAHGIPARVGRLRAYGNAIVPQVAAAFVSAYLECQQ